MYAWKIKKDVTHILSVAERRKKRFQRTLKTTPLRYPLDTVIPPYSFGFF